GGDCQEVVAFIGKIDIKAECGIRAAIKTDDLFRATVQRVTDAGDRIRATQYRAGDVDQGRGRAFGRVKKQLEARFERDELAAADRNVNGLQPRIAPAGDRNNRKQRIVSLRKIHDDLADICGGGLRSGRAIHGRDIHSIVRRAAQEVYVGEGASAAAKARVV